MPKLVGPLPVGLSVFDVTTDKDYMVMGTGQMKLGEDINSDDTVPSVIFQDADGNVTTMREDHFRDRYALLTIARSSAVTQATGPKIPDQKVEEAGTSNKQPGVGGDRNATENKPSGTAPPAPASSKGTVGTKSTEDK